MFTAESRENKISHDDPRYGGIGNSSIAHLVFPKSGLGPGKLRSAKEIKTSALRAFRQWGGARRPRTCSTSELAQVTKGPRSQCLKTCRS
jgi:hypothetical protein